jgi:hypothetical protein
MIDRNVAIMGTFRVAMDAIALGQGWQNVPYQQKTLEWLAQSDESTSFQTRGLLEGFWGNEPATSPNDEVLSKRG